MACKNNDRYDVSRNDCSVFPSASEYLKRVANQNNTIQLGDKTKFNNYTERLRYRTQQMHTGQFVVKGNPPVRYKKSAILTTGSMNECDQWAPSSLDQVKRANYFVRRRYSDVETV